LRNIYFILFILCLSSCKLREKIVYFQDQDSIVTNDNLNFNPKIKVDDLLNITVYDISEENTSIFNAKVDLSTGSFGAGGGYVGGIPVLIGYLVDNKGEVEIPVIGKVKVEGLTRTEAIDLIQSKISKHLVAPVVRLNILNFKITVLGDVRTPGTYRIPNERITILEAIGLAGDLNITAKRDCVTVIRENKQGKTKYIIDLRSMDLMKSPVYYLEQNDVVYIEPNFNAMTNSNFFRTAGGQVISILSLLLSAFVLLSK
jgi:polysaccharide biosynthesis/export protein